MANYAVVKSGVVENVVVWDGLGPEPDTGVEGSELIEATSDCCVGGTYNGSTFTHVEPTDSAEDIQSSADRTSGLDKLIALGLTEAEITALGIG